MHQNLLFRTTEIIEVMELQKRALAAEIQSLSEEQLAGGQDELISQLVDKYCINVPILGEGIYITDRELDIDYTHDRSMAFNYGTFGEPLILRGVEVTVHIPFKGDPALFQVRPGTYTLNPPRGEVIGSELQLAFRGLPTDNSLKQKYERSLEQIRQYLDWMRQSAQQLSTELRQSAQQLISKRKEELAARASVVASFGLPTRSPVQERPPVVEAGYGPRRTEARKSEQKWDVFIAHATEDQQEVARELANDLAAKGLTVWYSEFSLKVGDSLRQSIDRGLAHSRFGVVVLSKHFFEKHWPQQELNGLATRESGGQKVILPVWHKVTVEEVRQFSPMLADRLAVSTDEGQAQVVKRLLEAMDRS